MARGSGDDSAGSEVPRRCGPLLNAFYAPAAVIRILRGAARLWKGSIRQKTVPGREFFQFFNTVFNIDVD